MQPILMLAVVGVAAVALGTGFLNNNIELWIQEFGVGSDIIESPVETTEITPLINRIEGYSVDGINAVPDFKDFVVQCDFVSVDVDLPAGTKIYCKLLDGMNIHTANIIATGFIELDELVLAGELIQIPITEIGFENANSFEYVQNIIIEIQEPPLG